MSMIASGLSAWLVQRVSAVYIVLFLVYALISLGTSPAMDYQHWQAWVNHGYRHLFLALFFLALLVHAWVGGRDVILDYLHGSVLRLGALVVLALILLWLMLWSMRILLSVATP